VFSLGGWLVPGTGVFGAIVTLIGEVMAVLDGDRVCQRTAGLGKGERISPSSAVGVVFSRRGGARKVWASMVRTRN
jgi:hypothetical protein